MQLRLGSYDLTVDQWQCGTSLEELRRHLGLDDSVAWPGVVMRGDDLACPQARRHGRWARRPDTNGLLVVQRERMPAPTPGAPCGPVPVEVDAEPADAIAIPWAALLPSVAAGIVMAFIFSPFMIILSGVSAAVMVGRSVWSRVARRRRLKRRASQLMEYALAAELAVASWAAGEEERQRGCVERPASLRLAIESGTISPWRQRSTDPISLGLGQSDMRVSVDVVGEDAERLVELRSVPYACDLAGGRGLGVSGDREPALRLARWLAVSAAASYGPADLRLALLVSADRLEDWDWIKWLPGNPAIAVGHAEAETVLAASIDSNAEVEQADLVIVDGLAPLAPGHMASLLSGRIERARMIWIGPSDEVPAGCETAITVFPDDTFSLDVLGGDDVCGVADGLSAAEAREMAIGLAPLDDPECMSGARSLPHHSILGDLVSVHDDAEWADALGARWPLSRRDRLEVSVGVEAGGDCVIDMVADGPHMLVAGTTGAGKSEFLRTLVAGLAVAHPPTHCSFVLVDFKGGGAFDVVSDLPHVAAVVTDLDAAESERALRSLRSELHDREETLRAHGASSIEELADDVPLARMMVVVDEFAALADELPDFLDGLVDIARRGRSLGVHLVLATQRPAGVVTGQIRANTALRVCLRVQDKADSIDLIDCPDGALLPPVPGRAIIMRQGTLVAAQIAQIAVSARGLSIRPFVAHESQASGRVHSGLPDSILSAVAEVAFGVDGLAEAARAHPDGTKVVAPWAPPLDRRPDWRKATVAGGEGFVGLGWLDDPVARCHRPAGWQPDEGGLMIVGADAPRVAQTVELAVAGYALRSPGVPVYVVNGSGADLTHLAGLPSVGDVIAASETERVLRLLTSVGSRRADSCPALIVIHGFASVIDLLVESIGPDASNMVQRLVRDGASRGIGFVLSGGSDREIPMRVASLFAQRVVHRLADPAGYLTFGLKAADGQGLGVNDVVDPTHGHRGRIGWLGEGELGGIASLLPPCTPARPVRVLGDRVDRDELPPLVEAPNGLVVPIGLDQELAACTVTISASRPLIIVGHPESGRSTSLATLRSILDGADADLVDDADQLSTEQGQHVLGEAAAANRPLVLATTMASVRQFGSWIAPLLASATVVLLNPARQDGEPFRAAVPDLTNEPTGRSVVIDRGRTSVVQVAA